MYEAICVPTGRSPQTRKALLLAKRLAEAADASLVGLQVDTRAAEEARLKKLSAMLPDAPDVDVQDTHLPAADVPFETKIITGKPHEALQKAVEDGGYDLVVMEAGATSERLLKRLQTDVLVVKTGDEATAEESDTILVCMDGSRQAFGGLLTAIELGKKTGKGGKVRYHRSIGLGFSSA